MEKVADQPKERERIRHWIRTSFLRGYLKILDQALQHDLGHGDVNPAFVRADTGLVALGVAAGVVKPEVRSTTQRLGSRTNPSRSLDARHHGPVDRKPLGRPA